MSRPDRPQNTLSRRALLKGAAALAGTALIPLAALEARAGTSGKIAKSAVNYQDHPSGGRQCSQCAYYLAPASDGGQARCKIVQGLISPKGYCIAYAPA